MSTITPAETESHYRKDDGVCRFPLAEVRRMASSRKGNPRYAFRVKYARDGEGSARWRWIRTTVDNGASYGLSEWSGLGRDISCTFDGRGAVVSWEIHETPVPPYLAHL